MRDREYVGTCVNREGLTVCEREREALYRREGERVCLCVFESVSVYGNSESLQCTLFLALTYSGENPKN